MNTRYEPIHVAVLAITMKAVLVTDGANGEIWIPKSLIHEDDVDCLELNEYQEINVASWFLEKEGWL